MKVSDKGLLELISHEAIVPMPYKDSVGVWTWGIGHTKAAGAPNPVEMERGIALSIAEVIDVFKRDIKNYEDDVNKAVKVPLEQHQFDALVSFHYNTGAISRASLVKKLNRKDYEGAADGLMDWNKPREIIGRREKEQKLFEHGEYGTDGKVTVYQASSSGRVQWGSAKRIDVTEYLTDMNDANGTEQAKPTPVLRAGDRGVLVEVLQTLLGIHNDGNFGPQTKRAVVDFQEDNGLVADGVVGVKTWSVLRA